eukprot:12431664-Alexandrium_andersonii.AAC.1
MDRPPPHFRGSCISKESPVRALTFGTAPLSSEQFISGPPEVGPKGNGCRQELGAHRSLPATATRILEYS